MGGVSCLTLLFIIMLITALKIMKEMICIICPVGCRLTVYNNNGNIEVNGNSCGRGQKYGISEFTCPVRVVTTSIKVKGGERPVVSVKTSDAVPFADIKKILKKAKSAEINAPVKIGDIVIKGQNGINLIATSNNDII